MGELPLCCARAIQRRHERDASQLQPADADRKVLSDGAVLREAVEQITARYYHVTIPGAETDPDPVLETVAAICAGVLDSLPGGQGAGVLRGLGELGAASE